MIFYLLTMDLPHRKTPYSLWTCPTAEHPTHLGPTPCETPEITREGDRHQTANRAFRPWDQFVEKTMNSKVKPKT